MKRRPIYKSPVFYIFLAFAGYTVTAGSNKLPALSNYDAPLAVVATATPTDTPTPAPTFRPTLGPAVYNYALAAKLVPKDATDGGPYRCDYTVTSSQRASITWIDGAQAHTVSGDAKDMRWLYVDMLEMEPWQSCTYAAYLDGDILYIKHRPDVRDGQVAVVLLDDEATLKHVYHDPDGLTLLSDNHDYAPIRAHADTYDYIAIYGVPVGYTRIYKKPAKKPRRGI